MWIVQVPVAQTFSDFLRIKIADREIEISRSKNSKVLQKEANCKPTFSFVQA